MESNRFFHRVWQFNAVVIALAGVLALALLLFASYHVIRDATRERAVTNVVNTDVETPAISGWDYGLPRQIDGHAVVVVPLQSGKNIGASYFKKNPVSVRDLLFIRVKSDEKQWLFDRTDFLILEYAFLADNSYRSDVPVKAVIYQVVKTDTNNDQRLSYDDTITIGLSHPDGSEYTELVTDVTKVIGRDWVDDDRLMLLYVKEGKAWSAVVDLDRFSFEDVSELPAISAQANP
ncbi:Uncharacterised protein [BD1-7 clade bacterium]|uniref:Uncharacterized protein n=1 Tax=BD1-7 clade bacterium TaxID=2029982 RepID=A0A5S9PQT2_9GAMM|nr:Uncharacterised protein [BD1-7 clade bacterium]